jgi:hypothetical protein
MIERIDLRIKALVPEVDFTTTCILIDRNDGEGTVIGYWNEEELGPKPTDAELLAATIPDQQAELTNRRRNLTRQLIATSNEPIFVAVRAAIQELGTSLREARQELGLSARSDVEFLSDVLSGINRGQGEV